MAPAVVYCAKLHEAPTVSGVAPAHSSLAGGGGSVFTHTLKEEVCPAVEVQVATRMKYVCPGVSADTVLVLGSLQTNAVAAPQLLSTWWVRSVVEPVIFNNSIECELAVATKENHTSSS